MPTKPKYIPNQRPPPQVHSSLPEGTAEQSERSRKVIISRSLLLDGNVSFAVGTQIDGVITPDAREIPIAEILDHVSPAELERYENRDFFDEDERERLPPPTKKPRVRRVDSRTRDADESAHEYSSTKSSVRSTPSTAIKGTRGRLPRQENISVVIPSFNGPQPKKLKTLANAESESDDILDHPKPQYSMVVASGLGQSDTEYMTSRDHSAELEPSSKKRRSGMRNDFIDLSPDDDDDDKLPHPAKKTKIKILPETSPDPIIDDSAALLRQFQARVYCPDPSTKGSTIPLRQSNLSSGLEDSTTPPRQFHPHTRPSSLDTSSSDSLMGPTPRSLNPLPTQHVLPSLPGEAPPTQRPAQRENPAKSPAPYLKNSIMVSRSPRHLPTKTPPAKTTSPSKFTQKKVSLTPHFPPSTSFSNSKSLHGSAHSKPQPSISSSSKHGPSQSSKTTVSQSSRTMPSPLNPKPSPEHRSAPPNPSPSSATSRIGFAGLPPPKHITDYFAPKATVAKMAPIKAPHHPSPQRLRPEDSESEDELARKSSTDSIGSEVIAVRQNRIAPTAQAATAEARPHGPSNGHDPIEIGSSEDDSSDGDSSDERDDTARVSTAAAPRQPPANPETVRSGARAVSKAFEIDDDDDDDDNSDSGTDSVSSDVMIIRSK